MKNGRDTPDFWRQRPYLQFPFLLAWSGFIVLWCYRVWAQGDYELGQGEKLISVNAATHPVLFWLPIAGGLALAAGLIYYNVRCLHACLHRSRTSERTA